MTEESRPSLNLSPPRSDSETPLSTPARPTTAGSRPPCGPTASAPARSRGELGRRKRRCAEISLDQFISTFPSETGNHQTLRLWIRTFDTLLLALPLLLSASLVVGPAELASSAALERACGVWCPCEEERHDKPAAHLADAHTDCEGSDEAAQSDKAPCPDDCPDCDCCPGLMGGLLTVVLSSLPWPASSPELHTFSDAPAYGEVSGIFRPPRSLT